MSDDHSKLSPEENARIAAAFFLPGLERAIDVIQGLIHELQAIASPQAPKSKRGGKRTTVAAGIHDQAVQRVLAGEKVADIAHALGVNPASVYAWTKRVRDGQPPPNRKDYWTPERRAEKSRQIKAAWRKRQKAKAAAG